MDTRSLCRLCFVVWIFHGLTVLESTWTLTGSSEFAVAGESFTLICNPPDSNAIAVKWKRLDIDTTATGTCRASVEANGCRIDNKSDTQYQYTCEPGPVYKLTIPANVMTNSHNNIVWKCEHIFGGAAAEYKVKVQDATWTLKGSSEFAVAGESFTLTCNPQDNNAVAVKWKRLDIDTTGTGTNRATIEATGCKIGSGSDTQYQYTCDPGPVYKLTIPATVMTNSQNNKVWRCESVFGDAAAEYKVKVQVPVSSVSIHADNAVNQQVNVIYDNVPKTYYCVANGCRPKANISVTTTGVTKGQSTESTITQNGDLVITRVSQVITANRAGSTAKTLQCLAVNIQGRQTITSQLITLNVYYTPIISLDTTTITVQEGDNPSRPCSAIGNPTPTVKWYRGNSELTSDARTTATLVFSNIDRNQADTYQCKATTGTIYFESSKSLSVVVYYPPVITVNLQNITENVTNVVFTCNAADGFPTNYTYHGWYQYIGSTIVRSYTDFTGMLSDSNRKITIPKVTFEDIGRYHCVVENGFHGRKTDVLQQGSSYFDVRVSAKFEPEEEARKPGELHKTLTINIKFFSNPPALMKDIKWINKTSMRNPLTDSDSISRKLINIAIQRKVYGKVVTLTGQSAVLTIASLQNFYLGYYQLEIHNGENLSSSFDFQIITSAPPEAPSEFSSAENGAKSVILTWMRGFNGGHAQTFVIRYTNTETHETKDTTIKDTNRNSNYTIEIDGLEPSTSYHFWIYSTNKIGNSTLSGNLIVQTLKVCLCESNSGNEPITATSVLIVILCLVNISLVIIIWRRGHCNCFKENGPKSDGKSAVRPNCEGISQNYQETNMYEGIRTDQEIHSEGVVDTYERLESRTAVDFKIENTYKSIQKTERLDSGGTAMGLYENTKFSSEAQKADI